VENAKNPQPKQATDTVEKEMAKKEKKTQTQNHVANRTDVKLEKIAFERVK